ncbi:hypothetical protein N8344_01020 [bacterium]|nr:hypothetical protein [bacterium]
MIDAKVFTNPELEVTDSIYKSIAKVDLLALAIIAQRINGEYLKRGGASDFVTKIEDGEEVQRYERVKSSNRFVMETIQQVDPNIITDELRAEAEAMLHSLEMDFMFKVLGDNMNDFESSIHQFIADVDDFEPRMHIGVVAYLPAYIEREDKQKELTERSTGSEYIGTKGEAIATEIEIISKRPATAWAGWNISAITTDGNRVSFFTTKDDLANKKGVFKIAAKVKDCGNVWKDPDIKETRLNYVK